MNDEFSQWSNQDFNMVDIATYIKALVRSWFLIASFVIFATGIAGFLSFSALKVYRVATVVQVGSIGKELVESQDQIASKIKEDVYGSAVRTDLGLLEYQYLQLKAETPKGTNLIVLSVETKDPALAIQELDQTTAVIARAHQGKIEQKREIMEEEIKYVQGAIALAIQKQRVLEEKVNALQAISSFQQDLATQFALISTKEQLAAQKQEVYNLNREVFARQNALTDLHLTEAVKYAAKDKSPLRPRPIFNMGITGIISMVMVVFVVTGREWWKRSVKANKKFSTLDTY